MMGPACHNSGEKGQGLQEVIATGKQQRGQTHRGEGQAAGAPAWGRGGGVLRRWLQVLPGIWVDEGTGT